LGLLALRRYLPYLRPYVGLVAVFGLAQLGALAASASIPKIIQYIIDGPVTHHQLTQLVQMAGILVLIGLLEFVFVYLRRNYSGIVSLRMETDLRNDFYAHLQSLQVSFHDNWQSGQLLSRAVSDIATVRRFVSFGLIWFLQTIVTFAVVFVLMLELDWKLAIVVTVCMLPIAYFSNKFHDKYKPIARRLQDQQGDLTTIIEEMATGVRIIKAFGRMPPTALKTSHVWTYLHKARGKEAPVRANREVALLSAAFAYASNAGIVDHNPCVGCRAQRRDLARSLRDGQRIGGLC